ncbi:hypothetical protein AGMMS50256_38890 [Betaproteobacteria bacterium]|nr:hypothetical protein AGMMS50256_38890 [Betaproteobacteria bacterium]
MRLFKTFMTALTAVTMFSAGSALAAGGDGSTFKVNEGYAFTGGQILTANGLNFTWTSELTMTGTDTFTEIGSFYVTNFQTGVLPGSDALNKEYRLVGQFQASGSAQVFNTPIGPMSYGVFDTFHLDLGLSYDLGPSGSSNPSIEKLLGTGELVKGDALITPGLISKGDWQAILNFTANTEGEKYFIEPKPFVLELTLAGVITDLSDGNLFTGPLDKTGSGDAYVTDVPEPASLALLGFGLIGLGLSRRRRS